MLQLLKFKNFLNILFIILFFGNFILIF